MGRPSFKIDRQRLRELRDERGLRVCEDFREMLLV